MGILAVQSASLSEAYDIRYVVIDKDTGEILDDAQGYGYKSAQKAYAAYSYKNRDKSKDKERLAKKKHIEKWIKEHRDFTNLLDDIELDIIKGRWGKDVRQLNAKIVSQLFIENNLVPDFTAGEFLKVWFGK